MLRLLPLVCVVVLEADGYATTSSEASVKAGLLYNFAIFVEWPDLPADRPIVVGVIDDNDVGRTLDGMAGRVAAARPVRVRYLDAGSDAGDCHILFVGTADDAASAGAVARVRNMPVLTVGQSPRFAQVGGIVRLYKEDSRVRIEINLTRAQRVKLKISSRLLMLATIVREAP